MESKNLILQRKVDSLLETTAVAEEFAKKLKQGDIVALKGELGSGKTYFVRQIAKSLNYKNLVTSPSFVILNIYEADIMLYHFDLYRIEKEQELETVGFTDFLNKKGIVFVEWPEIAQNLLPLQYYSVYLKIIDKNKREIIIQYIKSKE